MIDIYICEDNQKQLNLFKKYILDSIMIECLDMNIVLATPDPHEILRKIMTASNTGLFFLDIDLKSDVNGLTLAQRIRKVEALDFIIKDTTEHIKSKIHECLLDVENKYTSLNNSANRTFMINQNDKRITIDYSDIVFFETSSNIHKIILHAKKRVLEFTGQLKDIEKQLDYRFYRCHRSYLINKDNISEVDFNELMVYMNNGETCPVSVRLKKGLKKLIQ